MEVLEINNTVSPNEVKYYSIIPTFNFVFEEMETLILDQGLILTYTTTNNGVVSKSKDFFKLKTESNFDRCDIFIKNISETNANVNIIIKYTDDYVAKKFDSILPDKSFSREDFANFSQKIERSLNVFINVNDAISSIYHRVKPVESDNIFKEVKYKKYFQKECLNLTTEDGELPDIGEVVLTEWGSEYNVTDAEISCDYFWSIFGACEEPREGDYVIIPAVNTAFEVKSVVIGRDPSGRPIKYTLKIGVFQHRSNTEYDDDLESKLNKHEVAFNGEIKEEIENTINLKENTASFIYNDYQKSFVSDDIIMSEKFYDMSFGDGLAVTYKRKVDAKCVCLDIVTRGVSGKILSIGDLNMFVSNGEIFFGDTKIMNVVDDERTSFAINIFATHISCSILNNNLSEANYFEETAVINPNGLVELFHENYEIRKLAISEKNIARSKSNIAFVSNKTQKSGIFAILDDFKPTYNVQFSGESNELG